MQSPYNPQTPRTTRRTDVCPAQRNRSARSKQNSRQQQPPPLRRLHRLPLRPIFVSSSCLVYSHTINVTTIGSSTTLNACLPLPTNPQTHRCAAPYVLRLYSKHTPASSTIERRRRIEELETMRKFESRRLPQQ